MLPPGLCHRERNATRRRQAAELFILRSVLDELATACDVGKMAATHPPGSAPLTYTDDPEQMEIAASDPTQGRLETVEGKASDAIAVLLSVVPGLGHIYKGHKFTGMLLILGTPMAVGLALLIATGTAGFGVALLPVYWLAVMVHVYAIQDRVLPPTNDEGEEY